MMRKVQFFQSLFLSVYECIEKCWYWYVIPEWIDWHIEVAWNEYVTAMISNITRCNHIKSTDFVFSFLHSYFGIKLFYSLNSTILTILALNMEIAKSREREREKKILIRIMKHFQEFWAGVRIRWLKCMKFYFRLSDFIIWFGWKLFQKTTMMMMIIIIISLSC